MAKGKPPVPEDLTREDQLRLWAWVQARHPHLTRPAVRVYVDECLSHHRATGNRRSYVDWEAACRNWIGKGERFANRRMEARAESRLPLFQDETPREKRLH